jgi:RecG-like helicase
MSNQLTNPHFLYVECGPANESDIRYCIDKSMSDICEMFSQKPCEYVVNIIIINGTKFGYAYVWFKVKNFANILTGLNPDGSKRVEMKERVVKTLTSDNMPPIDEEKWNNMTEEERWQQNKKDIGEEMFRTDIKPDWAMMSANKEETITIQEYHSLPSLVKSYPFTLTDTHKEEWENIPFDEKLPVPDLLYVNISRARVTLDYRFDSRKLVAIKVAPWVTEKILHNYLDKYSSYKDYPIINLDRKKNIVTIEYEPKSHEAAFVKLMVTKLPISDNGRNTTLIFFHPKDNFE